MSGAISDRASPGRIRRLYGERGTDGGGAEPGTVCERVGCRRPAHRRLAFQWGSVPVCEPHWREDLAAPIEGSNGGEGK